MSKYRSISKAFNVNASLIRFWEKEFDVLKPKKNAKGNRKFTPEDIKNLIDIFINENLTLFKAINFIVFE